MKNKKDLKWVTVLLMDWADREARMMSQSMIGYPSRSVEGRMMSSSPIVSCEKGSRSPEVMMSRRISACDQAVKSLSDELRQAIHMKYEISGTETQKAETFERLTGASRTTYYRRLNMAHKAVADFLCKHLGSK